MSLWERAQPATRALGTRLLARRLLNVRADRLFLPGFAACMFVAWLWRGRSDRHRRMILTGTFFTQGPVLSRADDPLIVSWMEPLFPEFTAFVDEAGFPIFYRGLWTGLFLSLALYDWKTLGRSHPVTLVGPAWFALTWLISALGWRCRQIAGDLPRLKPLLSGEDAAMRPARFSTPPRTLAPVRRSATQPTFAEAPHVSIQSVGGVPVLPRHRLSCHCGAVVLELELPDGIVDPRRCDCSICRRKGAVVASVPLSGIRILQGDEHLRLYQFNTRVARHYFCGRCGIYTHHQRRSFPDQYGYNVGCLEGINPFLLPDVPVNDGIHHPADRPRPAAD